MATETRTTTRQRPKMTVIDKVKTTGKKKPTVREATPTTTRRGNSTRSTRR